uniref:Uncharacterized protein n=1 Tax=Rhizophora mucronata TaxID=61149 RepID=A0A2P2KHV8_RHIMU
MKLVCEMCVSIRNPKKKKKK